MDASKWLFCIMIFDSLTWTTSLLGAETVGLNPRGMLEYQGVLAKSWPADSIDVAITTGLSGHCIWYSLTWLRADGVGHQGLFALTGPSAGGGRPVGAGNPLLGASGSASLPHGTRSAAAD